MQNGNITTNLYKPLANRFPKLVSLPKFRFAVDITDIAISAGKDVAEIFPFEMFHQMVIVEKDIFKSISFRGHQKRGCTSVSSEKVALPFFQGKQTVHSGPKLAAHVPVIQWRSQYDHITVPDSRIDLIHIVLLNTRTVLAAVPAKTAPASMDVHAPKKEFGDRVAGGFGAFCK